MSRGGYNGTLTNGPTFDAGNGGSIVFDGVNDYVNINSSFSLTNNFTITTWCKVTNTSAKVILGFYKPSSPFNGWGLGYSISPSGGGTLNFWDGAGWRNSNIIINDGIWRQIVVIVSSTYLLSFYINGVFFTSIQGSTISSYSDSKAIGSTSQGFSPMPGNISITSLYNRALSATEILQNYNATKGRYGL